MRRGTRGGPGELDARRARVDTLLAGGRDVLGAAYDPLTVLGAVLDHQRSRMGAVTAAAPQHGTSEFPLLDLGGAVPAIVDEVRLAADALGRQVPSPLADRGRELGELTASEVAAIVETWLDDSTLVDSRSGFWLRVAAGPLLELGATQVAAPGDWRGTACAVCGGQPAASVIAEESGEFMAGSPRSLVCGRCASWWSYPRAVCVMCREDNSRLLESFLVEEQRWVRVDTCSTCKGYVKSFDLRQKGAGDVVPLVDDVATLTLDVWAQHRGFTRTAISMAGL